MTLSDKDIHEYVGKGKIKIDPFDKERIRAGSYRLALGNKIYKLKTKTFPDPREEKQEYEEVIINNDGYLLQPNEFIVGSSQERLVLSDDVAALLSTRGPIAQLGLRVLLSSLF